MNVEENILFILKVENGAVLPMPRCICATTRVKEAIQIDTQLEPYFLFNNYASATFLTMKYTPFEYLYLNNTFVLFNVSQIVSPL